MLILFLVSNMYTNSEIFCQTMFINIYKHNIYKEKTSNPPDGLLDAGRPSRRETHPPHYDQMRKNRHKNSHNAFA